MSPWKTKKEKGLTTQSSNKNLIYFSEMSIQQKRVGLQRWWPSKMTFGYIGSSIFARKMVENAHFLCVKFDKQGKTHILIFLFFKKEALHTSIMHGRKSFFCHISENFVHR